MSTDVPRLIRHCAEFLPKSDISKMPSKTRGIYVLTHDEPKLGPQVRNVVSIGMSVSGIKGRLISHKNSKSKGKLWTHFSVYEVWPNITDGEITELEGLFRAIYRRDHTANRLAKQKRFKKLHLIRDDALNWD